MHLGFVVLLEGSFQVLDLVASVDGSSGAIVVSVLEEVRRVDAHLTNQPNELKDHTNITKLTSALLF